MLRYLGAPGRQRSIRVRPTGATTTIPAPYGGLNLRDDITALRQNEARQLNNWVSQGGVLQVRPGGTSFATGMSSSSILRLASFETVSAEKLVAFTGTTVYDITSGTPSSILGSQTSGQTQYANYKDRLLWCNGADAPRDWDGTTVTATSWTGSGLTIANLINIAVVRDRVWFCEADQAFVWYGGSASITGTLTKFDLSQIAEGGHCMAIGSYSRDSGDGMDDFTVFVMSTGQVLVYQGDVSSTFSLVGKYWTNPPIGRQCLFNVGGELIIITEMGLMPVSAILSGLNIWAVEPWGKIAPGIRTDAKSHASRNGWNGHVHKGLCYINVPLSTTLSKQYVLNLTNGAWSTYTGLKAGDFASFGGKLYYGLLNAGTVLSHEGSTDNGSQIVLQARGAFIVPNKSFNTNMYTAARPKIAANGVVSGSVGVDTDYFETAIIDPSVSIVDDDNTSPWNDSDWNDTPWASPVNPSQDWISIRGEGRSVAIKLKVYASTEELKWTATDLLFKPGGIR